MNKSILMASIIMVATCFTSMADQGVSAPSFGSAQEPLNAPAKKVVIAGWNVDTGLVAVVSGYVEKEYIKEVHSLQSSVLSSKETTFKDAVAGLTKNTNDLVVILASAGDGKPLAFATVVDTKKKLAYVNVDFLATGLTNAVLNKQLYWRVERETMKSVGLLLGKKPCFNPRCVMSIHNGLDGLDKKGRNLCPPCRFQKK